MKRFLSITSCMVIVFCCSSCVVGPIRYKAIGFRKSATWEMLKSKNGWVKAGAIAAGPPIDAAIVLADTVWDPFIAFNLAAPHPMDEYRPELEHVFIPFSSLAITPRLDSDGTPGSIAKSTVAWTGMKLLLWPMYSVALLIEDEGAYQTYFGRRSSNEMMIEPVNRF